MVVFMNLALFETLENEYLTPEDQVEPTEDTRDGSEWEGFEYPD
jgi:hypothetical protein